MGAPEDHGQAQATQRSQALTYELTALGTWLCYLLALDVGWQIWHAGPLAAAYTWRGSARDERFMLALQFTPDRLKILNLWLPRAKRHQHLGSAIVARLLELCRYGDIRSVSIEPRPGSEGFWQELGFTPAEPDPNLWHLSLG